MGWVIRIVDHAFPLWYHHLVLLSYCLWRILTRAASLERRYRYDRKRTPRNIDSQHEGISQHEGMELHRGCPGNVDAEISFRVILFSNHKKTHPLFNLRKSRLRYGGLAFRLTPSRADVPCSRIVTH